MKLIGWPSAGGLGKFEVVGKSELPSIAFMYHTMESVADITGAGAGTEKQARPARAVGIGMDYDLARAQREEELEERSPWVVELTTEENSLGRAIMLLAGGREFLEGKGVRLQGNGMAPRAARYIHNRRGRIPSDTSLDDAAASAAAELVKQVHVWEYVLSIPGELPAERIRTDSVIRTHLSGHAWRAAFRSLDGDGADGFTGRQAGETDHSVPLALDVGQIASARASLQAHFAGKPIEETHEQTTRRAVCSWLWRALVPTGKVSGANAMRARDCARMRARFLIRLVHGQSWADAARLAGFSSGADASKILALRHTWATLAAAQAAESGHHPIGAALRAQWAQAARAEVTARRAARPLIHTTAARGARRKVTPGILTPGGAVLVRSSKRNLLAGAGAARLVNVPRDYYYAAEGAPRVSRKVASLRVDIGAAAARAIAAREQAARRTSGAAARLAAFRARAQSEWTKASKGLRKGFLRK